MSSSGKKPTSKSRPPAWAKRLLAWFHRHRRAMPWRDKPIPYYVWISEIMLQQTTVRTVIPYFERFVARFPTLASLARADLQDVLRCWEGLGYYARARHMHRAAQIIIADHNGEIPSDPTALLTLPGIGAYTAGAVSSISFGIPIPAIDGNVLRVFARFRGIARDIRSPAFKNNLEAWLSPIVKTVPPSDFNQAVMELGALVCTPRSPSCAICPLCKECSAFRQGKTTILPVTKRASARIPHHTIAAGIIWKGRKILVAKRKASAMLGGLWEFPGGKQHPGETLQATAAREILEETGIHVDVGPALLTLTHTYSHFRITLTAFHCRWRSGRVRPLATDEIRWISPAELSRYPMPRANRRIAMALLNDKLPPHFDTK